MSASVLIADDDPNILRALSFLMQREGHQVRTAADGQQALAAIAETPPDLVLLDLMMPKGNGYDVCRTLRVDRAYDDVRIVMLTAKGCEADQRVGMDLGADAYITKPFAIADVVRCVAEVLGRRQPRAAAPGGLPRSDAMRPRS
jgi:DNA-binding response OmpR family regulator